MDRTTQSIKRSGGHWFGAVVVAVLTCTACGSVSLAESSVAAEVADVAESADITDSTDVAESADINEAEDAVEDQNQDLFPDVLAVEATQSDDGTWRFSVTLSSPYDSPARYADAWRVRSVDNVDGQPAEYGVRVLTHDHSGEQPFTRSHSGIEIPDDVTTVLVEGRDQVNGWGGMTMEFALPGGS